MRKAFKYRLYPTKAHEESLRMQLSEACRLYNAALQERRDAHRSHRISLNDYTQANQLKEIRDAGEVWRFRTITALRTFSNGWTRHFRPSFGGSRRGKSPVSRGSNPAHLQR